jgi:hypothetical protein
MVQVSLSPVQSYGRTCNTVWFTALLEGGWTLPHLCGTLVYFEALLWLVHDWFA